MLMQRNLLLLWVGLQASLILLLQQAFAWWIILVFTCLLLFRAFQLIKVKTAMSLKLVNVLAGVIALALLLNIKQAGVLHFMLQILTLAALSRLLALRHLHEARQLVWVHYFLIGCCFILHQDMAIALIIFLVFAANLYSHYRLFAPDGARLNMPQTARSVVIILPLWLAMFLLFPRLPPFWQIPNANVASTGLSDTLDPGSIEQLVQDDSLAFRVEFSGTLPPRQQLYWRSYLYEDFDGRSWQVNPLRKNANRAPADKVAIANSAEQLQYRVIAEATHQTNLFALAIPASSQGNVFIARSGLVSATKPVSQRLSYQINGISQPASLVSDLEQQVNLRLPEGNPQSLAFAQQLAQQYPQPAALVQAIATHFTEQPYFYSLTPLALGRNSVDQFMFSSRTGFCSHYASASALILRSAGIPARVVGGYQGGDWHAEQGYLAVRQREAHAWVEYLDNGQWQTFDPTAAVAPERILDGLDSALTSEQRQLLHAGWLQLEIFQTLRQQLMHLDYYWSVWVLGFDDNNQMELWQTLRQKFSDIGAVVVVVLSISALLTLYFVIQRRPVNAAPEATQLLQRACRGVLRDKTTQQSLSAHLRQLGVAYPQHRFWLEHIILAYENAVYSEKNTALQALKQLLTQHRRELKALRRAIENT